MGLTAVIQRARAAVISGTVHSTASTRLKHTAEVILKHSSGNGRKELLYNVHVYEYNNNIIYYVSMRDEKEGRKKQARSKAKQHSTPKGSHFS